MRIEIDISEIKATIYHKHPSKESYYAKVDFSAKLGLYFNSFSVEYDEDADEIKINPPAIKYNANKAPVRPIEFSKTGLLWKVVQEKIRDALIEYRGTPIQKMDDVYWPKDEELSEEGIRKSLDEVWPDEPP